MTGSISDRAVHLGLDPRLAEVVAAYAPAGDPRPAGAVVVGADLDRTLVYSARALGLTTTAEEPAITPPRLVVAELYLGEPLSFLTRDAEALLEALARAAVLVPTTTRTRQQYERIQLPGPVPPYAITTNGGQLLVGGEPDPDWARSVAERLGGDCVALQEVTEHLEKVCDPLWTRKRRIAEELFAYLVVERDELPAAFVPDLSAWCADRGWAVSLQGRKIYCIPGPLTKAAALQEVKARTGASWCLAAGDSLLDADMLLAADEAIRPAHGELDDASWTAPHLTVSDRSGVLGGEEIVARLLAAVLAG